MENQQAHIQLIESAIELLGVDPAICRTDKPDKWYLHRGKAQVVIMLRKSKTHTNEQRDSLVMVSPVLMIPKEEKIRNKVYRMLLTTSHQMVTESFSIAREASGQDVAYISATYYIGEMNKEEVAFMLDSLSYYAFQFTAKFEREFNPDQNKEKEVPPFKLED